MIRHQKCHGVSDVDKFLNDSGLRLDQVQIVYGLAKFGGDYYVFYEAPDEKPSRRKPPEPDDNLQLVPVDKTDGEAYSPNELGRRFPTSTVWRLLFPA